MNPLKMSEAEAVRNLINNPIVMTHRVHCGKQTIVGAITPPLMIEETEGGEEIITHVSVEGMIVATHITGLPLPIEEEEAIKLTLIPIAEVEFF
jgi:hypothetical protein